LKYWQLPPSQTRTTAGLNQEAGTKKSGFRRWLTIDAWIAHYEVPANSHRSPEICFGELWQ